MTPAELRARTHLTRAAERVGAAYSVVGLGDRVQAQAHIDGAIAALVAASEALAGTVLRMQPREGA